MSSFYDFYRILKLMYNGVGNPNVELEKEVEAEITALEAAVDKSKQLRSGGECGGGEGGGKDNTEVENKDVKADEMDDVDTEMAVEAWREEERKSKRFIKYGIDSD